MTGIIVGANTGLQGNSSQTLGSQGLIGNPNLGRNGENVYVNAQTGNLVIQSQDSYLSGVGPDLPILETYNSLTTSTDTIKDYWNPSVVQNIKLTSGSLNAAGSTVRLITADGGDSTYTYNTTKNLYVLADGAGSEATLSNNGSQFTWTAGNGESTQIYQLTGTNYNLIQSKDLNGNVLNYSYNGPSGALSSVTTADGETTYLDYNANNLLSDLRTVYTGPSGSTTLTQTTYGYDSNYRLSTVTVDLTANNSTTTYVTTYGYQGSTKLINSITQSDGTSFAVVYNSSNQVTSFTQTVNGVARTTTLTYNSTTQTTVTDPLGYATVLTYNATGQLLTVKGPAINGTSQLTTYTYDPTTGNVATVTDPAGEETKYTYDGDGNLLSAVNQAGVTVSHTYGSQNQLLSTSTYLTPASGSNPASNPQTTYYIYDTHLNLRFAVSPDGQVIEYRYSSNGEQTSQLTYAGTLDTAVSASTSLSTMMSWAASLTSLAGTQRIDTTYDFRGNVASTTSYSEVNADGTGSTGLNSEVTKVLYVYNQAGQLISRMPIQEAPTQAETYTYDGLGRVLTYTDLYGNVTTNVYTDSGDKTTVTMANGLIRTSQYDSAGELTSVTDSTSAGTIRTTSYAYDSDGRLRMMTDPSGLITYYIYDEAGRQVATLSPNGELSQTVYNADDEVVETIAYGTLITAAAAHAALVNSTTGAPATVTLLTSGLIPTASALDRKTFNFYDTANRLTESVDALGDVTTYTYDGASQLLTTTAYATPLPASVLSALTSTSAAPTPTANAASDRTTENFYDNDGHLRGTIDGAGYLTEYRYTAASQLAQTIQYATKVGIDASGTLASLIPAASALDIHTYNFYDGRGLLRSSVDGDGFVTSTSYDEYGNVAQTVQGTQINATSLLAPQTVPITFTATGTAYNGVWPSITVYVDGVAVGTVSINSSTATPYTIEAANIVPLGNHTIDFVLTNSGTTSGTGPSFSYSNAKFGATVLASNGDTSEFTAGSAAVAITHVGAVVGSTTPTISVNGGSGWSVSAAQIANTWGSTPTDLQTTAHTYNAYGKLLTTTRYLVSGSTSGSESDSASYDSVYDLTSLTNVDRTQSNQYDAEGNLLAQMNGVGSAALAALPGNATASQIAAVWTAYATKYTYDAAGQRITATDPAGHVMLYYYNSLGKLADVINNAGEVTDYEYDAFGDLVQTTVYAGRLTSSTLSSLTGGLVNSTLTSALTALAQPTLDSVTKAAYGNTGLQMSSTDALGYQTTDGYDAFGELNSQTTPGTTGASINTGATTVTSYDQRGVMLGTAVTSNSTTLSTSDVVDAFGRVTSATDANGNISSTVYNDDSQVVQSTNALSQTASQTYDAFGNTITSTDARGLVTHYAFTPFNRSVTVTSPDGIVVTTQYNAHDQVVSLTDGNGNVTSYVYDLDGNLTQTTLVGANSVDIITKATFDAADRESTSTDGNGVVTNYSYDAASRLYQEVIDPGSGHLALTTTTLYNTKGEEIQVTDPLGVITTYAYDLDGQKVLVTVDPTGQNLQTQYTYDAEGRITQQIEGYTSTASRTTAYVYDGFGRLLKKIVDPSNLALTTTYTYDNNGNVVAVADADGNVTRSVYNAANQLIYSIDALGDVTANSYDGNGNLIASTAYATPISLSGAPLAMTASSVSSAIVASPTHDETTRYVYDGENRLVYTIDALGYVNYRQLDGNGNVLVSTRLASPLTISGTLTVALVASAITAQSLTVGESTTTIYDGANRAIYQVDPAGYLTANSYDANSNLVAQTRYATVYGGTLPATLATIQAWLGTAQSQNASADRTTRTYYDTADRAVYIVDPLGFVTANTYNADSEVTQTVRYAVAISVTSSTTLAQVTALLPGSVPTTALVTQFSYDSAARQVQSIDGKGIVTKSTLNAVGQAITVVQAYGLSDASTTQNAYDTSGRLISQTKAFGTAAAQTTAWAYDAFGNVLSITNGNGFATLQSFDALNRRTVVQVPLNFAANGTTTVYAVTTTHYDAFGNAITVKDPNGNTGTFYFDQLNRTVMEVDPLGYVTSTTYTAFGKPASVLHYANAAVGTVSSSTVPVIVPIGGTVPSSGAYVQASVQDALTAFLYDSDNRLLQSTDALNYTQHYTYDAFSDRLTDTNQLGGVTTDQYDQRGELVSETLPITSLNSSGVATAVTNQTQYDAFGNKIETIEAVGLPEQRITTFTYDHDNQLLSQTSQSVATWVPGTGAGTATPVTSFTYDDRGNQTSVTDANGHVTTYYYDAASNKIAEVSPVGTLTNWSYDAVGNMIAQTIYATPVTLPVVTGTPPAPTVNAALDRQTLYTYDQNNRLVATTINNITMAERPPGAVALTIYVGAIVTSTVYDADGNVIASADGRGNVTYSYYDANGNKVAQLDALNDLTLWTRDSNGNATSQTQYATPVSIVPTTSLTLAQIKAALVTSVNDRTTNYTYDGLGHLLTQSVLNVAASTVSGDTLSTALTTAVTRWTYDGLGDVLTETQANNDLTTYAYDQMGREISVQQPQITDYTVTAVMPLTTLVYNGLNLVVSETQHALSSGAASANDRTTTYTYGTGGRLLSSAVTGTNVATSYSYDAVGNVTQTITNQAAASGPAQTDATDVTYDAANRQTNSVVTWEVSGSSTWNNGDSAQTAYDAFGDVVTKGANGGSQEFMQYDQAGRLWFTNAGNGSAKVYLYDENGNETVLIKSAGANLVGLSLTQITEISDATASTDPAVVAAVAAGGTNMTVSVYDALNRLTDTYTPALQSEYDPIALQQFVAEQAGGNFSGGGVLAGDNTLVETTVGTTSPTAGTASNDGAETVTYTFNWSRENDSDVVKAGASSGAANTGASPAVGGATPDTGTEYSFTWGVTVTIPALRTGAGNFLLYQGSSLIASAVDTASSLSWSTTYNSTNANTTTWAAGSYVMKLYQQEGSNLRLVSTYTWVNPSNRVPTSPVPQTSGGTATTTPLIQFGNQNQNITHMLLLYRVSGSTGPWSQYYVPQLLDNTGAGINGWWGFYPSVLGAAGTYQFDYIGFGSNGAIYNNQTGTINTSTNTISQTGVPLYGSGQAYMTTDSVIQFTNFPINSVSAIIHYQSTVPGSAWNSVTVGAGSVIGVSVPNWFQLNTSSLSGGYNFYIETFSGANGTGTQLAISNGTFIAGTSVSAMASWLNNPAGIEFNAQPAASNEMILTYALASNPTATTSVVLNYNTPNNFFYWNASGIAPDGVDNYLVNYSYQVFNSANAEINAAHGQLQVGLDFSLLSHINDPLPSQVVFTPPETNATTMVLSYTPAGTTGSAGQVTLTKNLIGAYVWDTDSLRPTVGTLTLDYSYILKDVNGNVVAPIGGANEEQGGVEIYANHTSTARVVQWDITGLNNAPPQDDIVQAAIHKYQVYDAFGDVIAQFDGLGNETVMTYNALGEITSKALPSISVSDQHGNVTTVSPTTNWAYDIAGRLVGTTDADGNLTTYINLAGYGDIGGAGGGASNNTDTSAGPQASSGSAKVTQQFNPDTGVVLSGYDIFGDLRKSTDALGDVTMNKYDQDDRLITVTYPTRAANTPGWNATGQNADIVDYFYDSMGNRISTVNYYASGADEATSAYYDAEGRVTETVDGNGLDTKYAYSTINVTGVNGAVTSGFQKTTENPSLVTETDDTDYFGNLTLHQDFGGHTSKYTFNAAAEVINDSGSSGANISYAYYVNGSVESITDHALNTYSFFEYDENGNRIIEQYSTIATSGVSPTYYENAAITYNADGEVIEFKDINPDIKYAYDANGNRREINATYQDAITGATDTQDDWYTYDSMNRVTMSQGTLSGGTGGTIVTGSNGVALTYFLNGERATATYGSDGHTEAYTYTTDGYLETVSVNGTLRAERINDLLGRTTNYFEFATNGTALTYADIGQTYDNDNRLTSDTVKSAYVNGTSGTTTTEAYGYGAYVASKSNYSGTDQGVITNEVQTTGTVIVQTTWTYAWWDNQQQMTIQVKGADSGNPNATEWQSGLSNFTYDVNGHVATADGYTGGAVANANIDRTVTYTTDPYGQVLTRNEMDGSPGSQTQGPKDRYYYFDGTRVGDIGNDGPFSSSYEQTLSARGTTNSSPFPNGTATSFADFNSDYDAINSSYTASTASTYTVQNGDTLQGIAQKVWGDSSLWYLIANANGITNLNNLDAGQILTIPNKVANLHNSTATNEVYDPNQALGNDMPILPPEPAYPAPPAQSGGGGCGGFGEVLVLVVTVAAAVFGAYEALPELTSLLGGSQVAGLVAAGAVGGAEGSIAGQLTGMAIGEQKGFDWSQVGLAAVSGAVGGGIAAAGLTQTVVGALGSSVSGNVAQFIGGAASAAAGSLATTALDDLVGLPNHFSWQLVAADALGGGLAQGAVSTPEGADGNFSPEQAAERGALSGAVIAALAPGNLSAKLPSIIGNVIGSTIGSAVTSQVVIDANDARAQNSYQQSLVSQDPSYVNPYGGGSSTAQPTLIQSANGGAGNPVNAQQVNAGHLAPDAIYVASTGNVAQQAGATYPIDVLPDNYGLTQGQSGPGGTLVAGGGGVYGMQFSAPNPPAAPAADTSEAPSTMTVDVSVPRYQPYQPYPYLQDGVTPVWQSSDPANTTLWVEAPAGANPFVPGYQLSSSNTASATGHSYLTDYFFDPVTPAALPPVVAPYNIGPGAYMQDFQFYNDALTDRSLPVPARTLGAVGAAATYLPMVVESAIIAVANFPAQASVAGQLFARANFQPNSIDASYDRFNASETMIQAFTTAGFAAEGVAAVKTPIIEAVNGIGSWVSRTWSSLSKVGGEQAVNAAESGAADAAGVRLVGGRNPINSGYAGQTYPLENLPPDLQVKYPNSVQFTTEGFPDFSPYSQSEVQITGLTGNYAKDAAMANEAVGLDVTPEGYVWHHVEDGQTMQLIPQDIHNAVRHTGGAAVIRYGQ